MASGYELRRFMRSAIVTPVTLTFDDGKMVSGEIVNLSIVGMFVRTTEPIEAGRECEASFSAAPMKPVRVRCVAMHQKKDGVGMEIVGISNASFEFLREIVMLHSEDPYQCDIEIMSNMGSIPALYEEIDS
ncbi:MAG: PilZ domain-containing protein [Candidatus Hydrogenedentes bacterium]|nr:PilZ domain-containing protein [Candidatus Hydrogenedentota bacterium]